MATRIQIRRDTAANWTTANPILREGELGIETDTLKIKVGNSVATWSQRPYINVTPSELAELAQDSVDSVLVAGTGIDKIYDDANNTLSLSINNAELSTFLLDGASGNSYGLIGTSEYLDVKNTNGYNKEIELDIAAVEAKLNTDGYITQSSTSTLTNKTLTSPTVSGLYLSDYSITFEGQAGDDQYETILSVVNPTADRQLLLPDSSGHLVARDTVDTLTNKSIDLTSNTLTSTLAQINAAVTDANLATIAGSETLTNKTLTSPKINEDVALTATASELNILDGATLSTAELNTLDGITATALELNILDGATLSTVELNYVDGVTSSIQTQLDSKQPIIAGVSDTEIGYLDGVTSSIQTQINDKLSKTGGTMSGAIAMASNKITGLGTPLANEDASTKAYVDSTATTALNNAKDYTDIAVNGLGNTLSSDYVPISILSQPDGVATLDASGYVPLAQLSTSVVIVDGNGEIPLSRFSDTIVTTTDSQILTNKELDSPKINENVSVVVTSTELNHLDGVTSNIQTQIDLKVDKSGATMTGALTLSGAPTLALHAATKQYVDDVAGNINFHEPVKVASTANLALTGNTNPLVIDGYTVLNQDRVLLKDQTDQKENGIYVYTLSTGSFTRSSDADNTPSEELKGGDFCLVLNGGQSGYGYVCSNTTAITIGTTNITYVAYNAAKAITPGNGLTEPTPGTLSIDTNTTVDKTTAQTLTNKTISGISNTITNIDNTSLINDFVTIGSSSVILGDTITSIQGLTSISSTSFVGDLDGNALTVTDGVYTTNSYTDPPWLTLTNTKVGLSNVENIALSTWNGSSQIDTVGTITTGVWNGNIIDITKGGTGASTQIGAANAILPTQDSHANEFLMTDGLNAVWAVVPSAYLAPTVGGTTLESGGSYSTFTNLTLNQASITDANINGSTFTGIVTVPTPTTDYNAATKLYTDTKAVAAATESSATERIYTNERLEIVPLDDVSTKFNGSNSRFLPTVGGTQITIPNPLRLLVTINGIIQMLGNQDNHWLSPIAPDGFYIASDGYIEFSEPIPEGSTFDARLMPGKTSNNLEKSRYPFRATDILLGA